MADKSVADAIIESINGMIDDCANKSNNPHFIKNVGQAIMKVMLDELNYHNEQEFARASGEWMMNSLNDLKEVCDTYGKETVN